MSRWTSSCAGHWVEAASSWASLDASVFRAFCQSFLLGGFLDCGQIGTVGFLYIL
jgi:small ligand-binding sensory domain FIST